MPTALITVFDKRNLNNLIHNLNNQNYHIISTGGTYKKILDEFPNYPYLQQVSDLTGFPEILSGRVKTLHPAIYGGILAKSDNPDHCIQLAKHNIIPIDLVVANLYPFEQVINQPNCTEELALDNIDIGGVTLLRAAAKNFQQVLVICHPNDYWRLSTDELSQMTSEDRRILAIKAFQHTKNYDTMIHQYLTSQLQKPQEFITRTYQKKFNLKYGCNPHQSNAGVYTLLNGDNGVSNFPYQLINGNPSYINMLDAINSWQLVWELRKTLQMPAAASFKHTSPAGAAVSVFLSKELAETYGVVDKYDQLSPLAMAFVRARNADPMSSFGDFIALSEEVDVITAQLIKREVSDGIIAPGYQTEALEILREKKGGKYVIMSVNENKWNYHVEETTALNNENVQLKSQEFREIGGMVLSQTINRNITTQDWMDVKNEDGDINTDYPNLVVSPTKSKISTFAIRDMMVANTALKYTQSNSVAYASEGQLIAVGAGQQSRVDCVKLAGRKADLWFLRQHPRVAELRAVMRPGLKRHEITNAIIGYLEGDMTPKEMEYWQGFFNDLSTIPAFLTLLEKQEFISTFSNITMASDAFFPFRDSIDQASKRGVNYILQPGGSAMDDVVKQACREYNMAMVFTGTRLFYH